MPQLSYTTCEVCGGQGVMRTVSQDNVRGTVCVRKPEKKRGMCKQLFRNRVQDDEREK